MAKDWIPMREDLHEDPAILAMAEALETRPEHVVGYCHKFWSWASRNTVDGRFTNVTTLSIEQVLNLPTFLGRLQVVGWLTTYTNQVGQTCIEIPNFDRYLSQSAKKRADNALRKRHNRVTKLSQKARTKVTLQNSTEQNSNKGDKSPLNPLAPCRSKPVGKPTVEEVRAYCDERQNGIDPEGFWNFYEANGWVQSAGKPIRNWKAAVITWEKRRKGSPRSPTQPVKARLMTPEENEEFKRDPTNPKWFE